MEQTLSQAELRRPSDAEMADESEISRLEGQPKANFVLSSALDSPCLAIAGNGKPCVHNCVLGYLTCRIPEHRDQEEFIRSGKSYEESGTSSSRAPSIQRSASEVRRSDGIQPPSFLEGSQLDHLDLHITGGQNAKNFGSDASENPDLRHLWTVEMNEALEYAKDVKNVPAQFQRLQQAVMHNQNQLVSHDNKLEQLGQAFSAFQLDDALRKSEFIRDLQERRFSTANSQALEGRIESLIVEEATSFERVTEKQTLFDGQLRQLFDMYGQLTMDLERQAHAGDTKEKTILASSTQKLKDDLKGFITTHNALAANFSEINSVNTKRFDKLRQKHLELEEHVKDVLDEVRVTAKKQADHDSRRGVAPTEVKSIVQNIVASDSKTKKLKESLDIQERKIDGNMAKTQKELETLREEMAIIRSETRCSNKAKSTGDHQAEQFVPRQNLLAQVSHTHSDIVLCS